MKVIILCQENDGGTSLSATIKIITANNLLICHRNVINITKAKVYMDV